MVCANSATTVARKPQTTCEAFDVTPGIAPVAYVEASPCRSTTSSSTTASQQVTWRNRPRGASDALTFYPTAILLEFGASQGFPLQRGRHAHDGGFQEGPAHRDRKRAVHRARLHGADAFGA